MEKEKRHEKTTEQERGVGGVVRKYFEYGKIRDNYDRVRNAMTKDQQARLMESFEAEGKIIWDKGAFGSGMGLVAVVSERPKKARP